MKVYGIDTIEFGIETENYSNDFSNFLLELEELKQKAQKEYKEVVIKLGDINFVVKPKGQGFYSYKLECEDFHICFMSKKVEKNSPIYVRLISSFLWQYNYKVAYELLKQWFENVFNVKIITTKISRLDICCDTDEISFSSRDSKKIITKARKKEILNVDSENYEGKIFSGFTIGKGSPLMCRIYNKSLEIKKSNKIWFKEIWKQNNWNGNVVWRIEFQTRRKILKEFRIDNINDIDNKIESLWAYYTKNWCTIRQPNKDINMSRWKISKKWEKVQKMNKFYEIEPLSREIIKKGDIETLLNSCIGVMTSISALKGYDNINDTYLYIAKKAKDKNDKNNTSYKKEVEKKMNRYIKN